jgi:hypothetical protein
VVYDGNTKYGSYADYLIFEEGTIVECTDLDTEIATWTAGYGGAGTWAAGYYYVQVEVAQGRIEDEYTFAQIDALAWLYVKLSRGFSWPVVRIPFLHQTGTPPKGITTHDTSANGAKLGKSDPGPKFPWGLFFERIHLHIAGVLEDDLMSKEYDELKAEIARLKEYVARNKDYIRAEGRPEVYEVVGTTLVSVGDHESFEAQGSYADVRVVKRGTPEWEAFFGAGSRFGVQFGYVPAEMTARHPQLTD